MDIETKTVSYKEDYLQAFGWQFTEEKSHTSMRWTHYEYIYARNKNMPNYTKLISLENKYEQLKRNLRTYEPLDGLNLFICFLVLIIPGIVYLTYKMVQKSNIEKHNEPIREQMNKILNEAKKLNK